MTQATYYLTNHPGSPERRKNLYGQPKPREWLDEADRKIIKAIEKPKAPALFDWQKAKIKWTRTGITYTGMKAVQLASGLTQTTITYHCRRPDGDFKVVGKQPPPAVQKSKWAIKDIHTGTIYKNASVASRETGVNRKLIYNHPRFVRIEE